MAGASNVRLGRPHRRRGDDICNRSLLQASEARMTIQLLNQHSAKHFLLWDAVQPAIETRGTRFGTLTMVVARILRYDSLNCEMG